MGPFIFLSYIFLSLHTEKNRIAVVSTTTLNSTTEGFSQPS
jgi:hypothetical protein